MIVAGATAPAHRLPEGLRFHGAEDLVPPGAPLAWFLDYRIDGCTLARARGRRP